MAAVNILKFGTSSPADTSSLELLRRAGYEASDVVALVGKTEGNGCVNDFSRTLAAAAWTPLLAADAVTVFSGGTEGVLSPHVTFVVREKLSAVVGHGGLLAAATHTRAFLPSEVGGVEQVREVARVVGAAQREIIAAAGGGAVQVHLVLVKCPLLTSAQIEGLRQQGIEPRTSDTYESMALSRYASAVGVALAFSELPLNSSDEALNGVLGAMNSSSGVACSRASCSSGAELQDCHVLVLASPALGSSNHSNGRVPSKLHAVHGVMADAMDAAAVLALLERVKAAGGEVVQVFAKAEADPRGNVRGQRHTMNTDSDLHSTRHARAAVGGLLAGLVGDAQIYVSGGAEGQGPLGGGSLCIIYRVQQ